MNVLTTIGFVLILWVLAYSMQWHNIDLTILFTIEGFEKYANIEGLIAINLVGFIGVLLGWFQKSK